MLQPFARPFSAPHRLGFLCGGAVLLTGFLLWGIELLLREGGVLLPGIPPLFWHGYVMLYGFFPLFMLGFIYTAGPRWLNVTVPPRRHYAPVVLLYATGSVLALLARALPWLLLPALLLHLAGWTLACLIWFRLIARSPAADKLHARLVALAFQLGLAGLAALLLWALNGDAELWLHGVQLGVWGLLLPVFLTICHRMLPFFSGNVLQPYLPWRPDWLLYTWVGCCLLDLFLEWLQLNTLIIDLPFAALLLYTSWRWQLRRAFAVKLLVMLHAAFAWAGLALLLFSISELLGLAGRAGLGLAPLHALTLGFFCTMLLGFVTRVTLGHSGRPLIAGGLAWTCYWLMHGVALTRVVGEIVPVFGHYGYLLAMGMALVALALWGRVYLPMYWQARIDGQAD
ncbi:NnrS family protein [Chitinilyticum piscinae]|uniref:NnrS family protein n=1 Tax=Chitinilyticum piscinae TaxID=2866724 RepID=A0A8J7FLX1_9NEIS|nr:NnrS family protein [Chitinilyticum piscinae]MBE9608761.1 NnrS family protein [Chitinilyticum piscinae]